MQEQRGVVTAYPNDDFEAKMNRDVTQSRDSRIECKWFLFRFISGIFDVRPRQDWRARFDYRTQKVPE
jgi:hypothetical protein